MVSGPYGPPISENWKELAKTYPSLDGCTVKQFASMIKGDQHWEKAENGWILSAVIRDEFTKRNFKLAFAFDNTTDGILLSRAAVDDEDVHGKAVFGFLVGFMEGKKNDK